MRVRRNLTQPVVAATLLAGLVLPQAAEASWATPVPPPQPIAPEHVQEPVAVPELPTVKRVAFRREASAVRYRVKEGDCLWFIARAYLGRGRNWRSIYEANRDQIRNPDLIYPGQVFSIPRQPLAVRSPHVRQAQHRHRLRTAERLGEHQIAASELLRHQPQRPDQKARQAEKKAPVRAGALPPPNPQVTRPSSLVGDTFQGHRRVDGHFYRIKDGQLVWADSGTPIRGEWAKRLSQQVYPNREAAQPTAAQQPREEIAPEPRSVAAVAPAEEASIQGHRRVNGTFFVMQQGKLVWADDGSPLRQGSDALVAP